MQFLFSLLPSLFSLLCTCSFMDWTVHCADDNMTWHLLMTWFEEQKWVQNITRNGRNWGKVKRNQSQQIPDSRACSSFFNSSNVTGSESRGEVCTLLSRSSRGDVWRGDVWQAESQVSLLHWIATSAAATELHWIAISAKATDLSTTEGEFGNSILGPSADPTLGGVQMVNTCTLSTSGKSASKSWGLAEHFGLSGREGMHTTVAWIGVDTLCRLRRPSCRV